jgi:hypothetical protein
MRAIASAVWLSCLLVGCAGGADPIADREAFLRASGFRMDPANSPGRLAELRKLAPQKITRGAEAGRDVYLYADPARCICVFVGSTHALSIFLALFSAKDAEALYRPGPGAPGIDCHSLNPPTPGLQVSRP